MITRIFNTAVILFFPILVFAQINKIDNAVIEELQSQQSVHVLISLYDQAQDASHTVSETVTRIKQLQIVFLKSLSRDEFKPTYQYKTFAGISGVLTNSGLSKLRNSNMVRSVSLDMPGSGGMAQSLQATEADVAHNFGFTGKDIVVGVLDSGVDKNHPDLYAAVVHEYHFLNQGQDTGAGAVDVNGHGTNVTGIIASAGTQTPIGVAPEAKIVAIQVLNSQNRGWLSDWIAAVDYIVANNSTLNVSVINMSLVSDALYSGLHCDTFQPTFAQAAQAAKNNGIIFFASSGNRGTTDQMTAPACLSEVIAVGATYDSDLGREPNSGTYNSLFGGNWPACFNDTTSTATLACFTCRTTGLDLVAPGAPITSTGLNSGSSTYRGTSQASPQAAGVAALMLEQDPALTVDAIKSRITNSPILIADNETGRQYPFLNAVSALGLITSVPEINNIQPRDFSLAQNYPNPFNPATVISYDLKNQGFVSLKIYSTLGQEVATLVSESKNSGAHKVTFNAGSLASGLYLYRLNVHGKSETKKLILLR